MRNIKFTILTITVVFTSALEAGDGGYLFLKSGLSEPLKEIKVPSFYGTVQTETANGLYLGAGSRYRLTPNLRLEGEVGYRYNKISDIKVIERSLIVGVEVKGGEGNITSWSFIANIWYDIPFGKQWSMHLNGGICAVQVSLKNLSLIVSPVAPNPPSWKLLLSNDNGWGFAYQAGIGIAYQLSKSFIADLGYSYFANTGLEFSDVDGNKFSGELSCGNYQLSLRYLF